MNVASTRRVSKGMIAASIVLVLLAMMLPVCHMHSPFNPNAADHCTICISLHSALPIGAHAPPVEAPSRAMGNVTFVATEIQSSFTPQFAASRAPPPPAC